jgi:hypothetical protein
MSQIPVAGLFICACPDSGKPVGESGAQMAGVVADLVYLIRQR